MGHEPELRATADTTTADEDSTSTPGASDAQAEDLHAQVRAFLDTAPPELSAWASTTAAQLDNADEASAATVETRRRRRIPVGLVVLLLVPVVIWGVYTIGAPPASDQAASIPSMSAEQSAPPLDAEAVAEWEAKLEADPTDTRAMSELGTLYLMAGDFRQAGQWQQRILADHPDDIDARLALGVALFNQGEAAPAQEQWERAAELDPSKAEPHYNLGFLHLSADPPEMALVKQHWDKVVELDPDSSMAETISTHMGGVDGLQPPPDDEP